MPQETIAIICDCDNTLCPDTTDKLVRDLGVDSSYFWQNQVQPMVNEGWDPPLAYLTKLLEVANGQGPKGLAKSVLHESAAGVEFYPGALDFVQRIRDRLSSNTDYREASVSVEWYIVSSGIEEALRATLLEGQGQGNLRLPPLTTIKTAGQLR